MGDVDWACPAVVDCLWRRLLSSAWCVRAGDDDHPLRMFLIVSSVRKAFLPVPSRRAALAAMCGLSRKATMARCLYVAEASHAMGTLVRALSGPTTVVSGSYAAYLLLHTWSEPRVIPPRCIDVVVASDGGLLREVEVVRAARAAYRRYHLTLYRRTRDDDCIETAGTMGSDSQFATQMLRAELSERGMYDEEVIERAVAVLERAPRRATPEVRTHCLMSVRGHVPCLRLQFLPDASGALRGARLRRAARELVFFRHCAVSVRVDDDSGALSFECAPGAEDALRRRELRVQGTCRFSNVYAARELIDCVTRENFAVP